MSTREALVFSSVAARLEAGTYRPRTARQPSHVPPALVRRARLARAVDEVAGPALSCAAVAAAVVLFFFA